MKYDIIAKSKYGTEAIDNASDLKEAKHLVKEYRLAFGDGWIITYKKNNYDR